MFSWGGNQHGQLGDGTNAPWIEPVDVLDLGPGTGVVDLEVGGYFSLARRADGSVLSWGDNSMGQLGAGSTAIEERPRAGSVANLDTPAVDMAAGSEHALVALADGSARAWGYNEWGQLGDGSTVTRAAPVQVSGLGSGSGVVDVAAGLGHSLALKADGTVLAWGDNGTGQLGDGTTTERRAPVQVSGLGPGSGVVAVAAGLWHSLALKADGTVLAWGDDYWGQLGDGQSGWDVDALDLVFNGYPDDMRTTPAEVVGLGAGSGVVALDGGGSFTVAVVDDGSLLAWGDGSYGKRCDGTVAPGLVDPGRGLSHPVVNPYLGPGSGVLEASAGWQHTLVRLADGSVFACGYNGNGELGDDAGGVGPNGAVFSVFPVPVTGLGPGSGAAALAAGYQSSLATAVTRTTTDGQTYTPPPNEVSVGDVTVREGDSGRRNAYITLTLERPAPQDVTVILETVSQSADGSDYRPMITQMVRIRAGQSSKVVAVPIYGDLDPESDQQISVRLISATNAAVADSTGALTIATDDAPSAAGVELAVSDVTVYEGDAKTKLTFTVSLNVASTQTVSVKFRTTTGTATGSVDYLAKAGTTVSFLPGQTSKAVSVTVPGDITAEGVESFGVALSNTTGGAVIADATGTGTIIDDDI